VNVDNGHWEFPMQMGKALGFIYVIRDEYMDRLYLGRKEYLTRSGLKSNWKIYEGSSKVLTTIRASRPKSEFRFICIEEYKTAGGLSWAETASLVKCKTPLDKRWLNVLIPKISWAVKEDLTERHLLRLAEAIR
jgi:hypothetical protein